MIMKSVVLIVSIVFLLNPVTGSFEDVINQTKDEELKQRLISFEKKGIEKQVDVSLCQPEAIIAYAKNFLGTPHRMGGVNRNGIDCSGLVMKVFQKYKVSLPHSSHEQARYGSIIADVDKLEKGDLVFFLQFI